MKKGSVQVVIERIRSGQLARGQDGVTEYKIIVQGTSSTRTTALRHLRAHELEMFYEFEEDRTNSFQRYLREFTQNKDGSWTAIIITPYTD